MPVLEQSVPPRPSARDELREYRRQPSGLVRPRKPEERPDIEPTESDEELERLLARPESQFIGHSLQDEAELGYLGPEDNIVALPDGSKIDSTGPPLTRITRVPHNEEQFQQRKNAIFAAIDKIEADKNFPKKGNFCLVGKMPEKNAVPSLSMDIDLEEKEKDEEFKVPEIKSRKKFEQSQSRRNRPQKPEVPDHVAHPENYTKYALDWGKREQSGDQALAVRQLQDILKQKSDQIVADGQEDHEATPQSVNSLATMAKSIMSSESAGSRQERLNKRRANKRVGKPVITSKEIQKQRCTLSFQDEDD